MKKEFVVIGCGRFGHSVAKTLYENGHEVLALDHDEEKIQEISDDVTHAIVVDGTDEAALKSIGIGNFDTAVVSIGSDIKASIMATLIAKEEGVDNVVAKAQDNVHAKVLYKIGADRVIFPERDMGIRVANTLITSNVLDYIELSKGCNIVEIEALKSWENKSLKELKLSNRFGINVIALKHEEGMNISPYAEDIVRAGDIIVYIGDNESFRKLEDAKNNIITSSSNRIIKDIKLLHKKKDRWKQKRFFIEGFRSVEQCIKSNGKIIYIVYSSELLNDDGASFLSDIEDRNYDIYKIPQKIFKDISDTDNPQGILAVVEFNEYEIEDAFKENNFFIILDGVQDPGNLGTIVRSADAFGANGVIVTSGCVDVYNPKTIRSTMGSIFQIPIIHIDNIIEAIDILKSKNINIISSSLDTDKYSYDIDFKSDCALVIGNEGKGISREVLDVSDKLVKIPMAGKAESLNAGVASGVLMYEVLRQRV